MRRTSLLDVNQRFWRTIGRMRASATDFRKRRIRLSWDSPGLNSTLIELTPFEMSMQFGQNKPASPFLSLDWQAAQL